MSKESGKPQITAGRENKMENVSYQELLQLAYERINEKLFDENLTEQQFAQLTKKEIEIWNEIQKNK